jgi:hypothetical protein
MRYSTSYIYAVVYVINEVTVVKRFFVEKRLRCLSGEAQGRCYQAWLRHPRLYADNQACPFAAEV